MTSNEKQVTFLYGLIQTVLSPAAAWKAEHDNYNYWEKSGDVASGKWVK
jgi:hypothetical protein